MDDGAARVRHVRRSGQLECEAGVHPPAEMGLFDSVEGVGASLCLLEPDEPSWHLVDNDSAEGQARVRFGFRGTPYDLAITDDHMRGMLRAQPVFRGYGLDELGIEQCGRILLTVSLADELDGWHTKLVAAVLFV